MDDNEKTTSSGTEGKVDRYTAYVQRTAEAEKDPDFKNWRVRTDAEYYHRHVAYQQGLNVLSAEGLAQPDITDISAYEFPDLCNKSIPVYFVPALRNMTPEYVCLHNYIYRRWFRPYRSEIEGGRFFCKFFYVRDALHSRYADSDHLDPTQDAIDEFVSLNQALCGAVEAFPILYLTEPVAPRTHESNTPSAEMGSIPVFLVQTGVEGDLSAPIDFSAIPQDKIMTSATELKENVVKVPLETAVDFVMALEAREIAAVGLRPDPAVFGGSTSQLVDMEKYPEWIGEGEEYDRKIMAHHEERELRQNKQIAEGNYYQHPDGWVIFGESAKEYKRKMGLK